MNDSAETTEIPLEHVAGWFDDPARRFFFVGIGGAGMSALAAYRIDRGGKAAGSDRFFDSGRMLAERTRCLRNGIEIMPQDGSGPRAGDIVVASTAVESRVPDVVSARKLGLPIVGRPALLAACVARRETIAIAGSSGKSSVVAMTFEALRAAGRDPGVITGGDLIALRGENARGNAWGGSGPLVIEADESDKSLVRYAPKIGVVLNLHRDHDEPGPILAAFETFRRNVTGVFVTSADEPLPSLLDDALTFGLSESADIHPERIDCDADGTTMRVDGVTLRLPIPGRHNATNALAALAACRATGVSVGEAAAGLESYAGVGRRFELVGQGDGVEVIDDFAHNPAKVAATLETVQRRCTRMVALFQPHGYGPLEFMREALVDAVSNALRPEDTFILLETFYAGGTATRSIEAEEVAREMDTRTRGRVLYAAHHDAAIDAVEETPTVRTSVIVMGARDPDLPELARRLRDRVLP